MNINMNGRQIKSASFMPDDFGDPVEYLESSNEKILELSATHHGDHDQFWVVELDLIDGEFKEVARHNVRYIIGWTWA